MIELSTQQRRELRKGGWPPEVEDSETGTRYVLIRREMFERVRALLEVEDEIAAIEEMYPLVEEALDADNGNARESA